MVDAIVSAVLEQLSVSSFEQKIREAGVNAEVQQLKNNLRDMKEVVIDAEERQVKEENVRAWLDKLKSTLYDMEDKFDEVSRLTNAGVASMIKDLNKKLGNITTEKNTFGFAVIRSIEKPEPFQCISLVDESVIIGQVELKNELIDLLCENRSYKQKGPYIISLVGMRGTGKTYLAKVIYDNDKVTSEFEKKIWVSASNLNDELKMAKAIVATLEGEMPAFVDLESLLQHLCKLIIGRKILLVLDDVHIEDYNRWKPLHYCLENCLSGSKFLITTQKESISRIMKADDLVTIKELSDEECQSLFRRFAFFNKSPKHCEELEPFVKQIADRYKGLPLAIKVMGSFLCSKRTKLEWQSILNSEMWKVDDEFETGIPFLLLSYINLPSMVKRCFSYCALFPKNYLINKDQLIKLWMAQSYLGSENNKEMEPIGQEFFDQLVTRSFFQEFEIDNDGGIISCKMHEIVYNFLKFITRHEYLVMDVNGGEQPSPNSDHKDDVRQSILTLSKEASFPNSILGFKKLRSLLVEGGVRNSSSLPEGVFDQLMFLRALDISGKLLYEDSIVGIPSSKIGKLIHLRYLNFSFLKISELPEELCELYNLQTLEISQCISLNKLPQGMVKLINLRHVVNDETSLNYMPKGMERLTCLRTLKEFAVGGGVSASNASSLKCLESLIYLQGSLSIRKLGNMTEKLDPEKEKPLKNKKNLLHLYLNFEKDTKEDMGSTHEDVLEALQPPSTLELLEIRGYQGGRISSKWVMSLRKLRMLNLYECTNLDRLPSLGELPSLESLSISSMRVEKVSNEFSRSESMADSPHSLFIAFPKLKSLRFVNMEEWEEWDIREIWEEFFDSTIMPCLRSLSLVYCPKLKALPDHILKVATLEKLNISWCPLLIERYKRYGQGWDIPKIMINFKYMEREQQIKSPEEPQEF